MRGNGNESLISAGAALLPRLFSPFLKRISFEMPSFVTTSLFSVEIKGTSDEFIAPSSLMIILPFMEEATVIAIMRN